jgi:hypothetical protein
MQLPLGAYSLLDKLSVTRTAGSFADRFSPVSVFQVTGGRNNFAAFVYMCRLNLDLDGSWNSYGYDNPAKGSIQKHLDPLEGVATARSQLGGLGNACGDPNDKAKSKGFKNFFARNRNFYWAGIRAVTKLQAKQMHLMIDDRPELEAGLETYARDGVPKLKPVGSGYFPVINPKTGYYISGTSVAADGSLSVYNPDHYLNSTVVPYAVLANHWKTIHIGGKKVQKGDFGLAIENNTGASMAFVYGDTGTPNKVGECSQKLNNALGGGTGLVTFIAFPGSGSGPTLGKNPELLIPVKVLAQTLKLQANASDLAMRLALGRELPAATAGVSLNSHQSRLYKNFMSGLSAWTMTH